jgi:Holliday junction resolvase
MRRAAKRDLAEGPIVEALEASGAWVQRQENPDLLVVYNALLFGLEVKSTRRKADKRQKAQIEFLAEMARRRAPVHVVYTPEDALRAIGAIRH